MIEESWNFSKKPFVKSNLGLRYIQESEFLRYFSDKYYQNKWKSNNNFGEVTEVDDDMYDVVEVPPRSSAVGEGTYNGTGNEVKTKIEKTEKKYQFLKGKENLELHIVTNNQQKNKEIIKIKTDVALQDIQLQYASYSIVNENSTETFFNFIQYKNNNTTTLIFGNNYKKQLAFDEVDKTHVRLGVNNDYSYEIIFKVGKKDKNNQIKYGFYSNVNQQIVDFIYDDLELTTFYTKNKNRVYLAKKDTKFGFIKADGTILIPINKEKVEKVKNESSYSFSYQFLENNKYGIIFAQNYELVKTEAIFDYPIKEILQNYQKQNKRTENYNPITLIELIDKNGKSIGFANTNGTLYFKN